MDIWRRENGPRMKREIRVVRQCRDSFFVQTIFEGEAESPGMLLRFRAFDSSDLSNALTIKT